MQKSGFLSSVLCALFGFAESHAQDTWSKFESSGVSFESPLALVSKGGSDQPIAGGFLLGLKSFDAKQDGQHIRFDLFELFEAGQLPADKLLEKAAAMTTPRKDVTASLNAPQSLTVSGFPAVLQSVQVEKDGNQMTGHFLIVDAGLKMAIWTIVYRDEAKGAEVTQRLLKSIKIDAKVPSLAAIQLQELEAHCSRIRSELTLARPLLEERKKAAKPGDIMAADKVNVELQRFNQQAARLAKLEEAKAGLSQGLPIAIAKPPGTILFQPALHHVNGSVSHGGTGFFARTASGRIAALSCSHYLNFAGPPIRTAEWIQLTTGKPIARTNESWGAPGEGKSSGNDYLIMPAPDSSFMVQELDYRASPAQGERVWFPDKSDGTMNPIQWIGGEVEKTSDLSIFVRLSKPFTTKMPSGSPVFSAATGKVIGVFSGKQSTQIIVLTPARLFVEKATVAVAPIPFERAFGAGAR